MPVTSLRELWLGKSDGERMEQHSGLNVVDLVVFAVILLSGALALWRGFVREFFSLAAWTGAALVMVYFFPLLYPWMHHQIKSEFGAQAATGMSLFCLALVIFIPLGYFMSSFVRGRALTAIDRSLGFVFGLARGVLVVCLLFLITLWIWPEKKKEPEVLAQAKTRPILAYGAEAMKDLLPQNDMKIVAERINALDETTTAAPLDQPPTPVAATTTAATTVTTAKTDAAPQPEAKPTEAKLGGPPPSKDEIRQVIDNLLAPSSNKPTAKQ